MSRKEFVAESAVIDGSGMKPHPYDCSDNSAFLALHANVEVMGTLDSHTGHRRFGKNEGKGSPGHRGKTS
ncbi:MAG TPA: hypothetical protein VGB45_15475 [Abditibacterium sp.]|jgi:hypothetical protein